MKLPNNTEYEQAVLGSVITGDDVYHEIAEHVRGNTWFVDEHGRLWETIASMASKGKPVDIVSLANAGADVPSLSEMAERSVSTSKAVAYLQQLNEMAGLRRLAHVGQALVRGEGSLVDVANRAMDDITEALTTTTTTEYKHISGVLSETIETASTAYSTGGILGLPTGIRVLDKKLGGWFNSELIIIAGRPGMGKTALALETALAMAEHRPILFASLEMSAQQLVLRKLCAESGVTVYNTRTGQIPKEIFATFSLVAGNLSTRALYIDDTPAQKPSAIAAKARQIRRRCDAIGGVVVDYIQLAQPNARQQSRERDISSISEDLKALAKQLDIPVIGLSQLSRRCEERPDKRPMLSDLRESGGLENNADVVIFPYRPAYYNDSEDQDRAELIVAKQRQGPCGTVPVGWDGPKTRYYTPTKEQLERWNYLD